MPPTGDRRRVVVALDSGSLSALAIVSAARLATALSTELRALLVEDARLRRLAGLPFATELGVTSAQFRPFDLAQLERGIGVQAQPMRRALQAAAGELPFKWTLEVVRGEFGEVVRAHTLDSDLLVLGRTRRPSFAALRRAGIAQRRERRVERRAIVALFDGSGAGERALEAALALERRTHGDVLVALVASGAEQAAALRGRAGAMLKAQGQMPRGYAVVADAGVETVGEIARRYRAGAVLFPVTALAGGARELDALVDDIACPVVLIP